MKISVVYNKNKDKNGKVIADLKKAFAGKAKLDIFTEKITQTDIENTDLVMVIGGDGTIIRAAKAAACHGIPVCGINLGRIGFLAAVEPKEIFEVAEDILKGNYIIEERMMFDVEIISRGKKTSLRALNDIAVFRGNCHKMIDISIDFGDEHIDEFRADGVVVATPTGSTAYSLSAGGPVVSPAMEAFIVTPVCAYDLHSRSMILTADNALKVSAKGKFAATIEVDGVEVSQLDREDRLIITRSEQKAKVIKRNRKSFLKILRNKFCI